MMQNDTRLALIARYQQAVAASDAAEAVMLQYAPGALVCRQLAERNQKLQMLDWEIANFYGASGGIADTIRQLQAYVENLPEHMPLEQMYQTVWLEILQPVQRRLDRFMMDVHGYRRRLQDDVPMPDRNTLLLQISFHDITEPMEKARELLLGRDAADTPEELAQAEGYVKQLETLAEINRDRADYAVEMARGALQPAYRLRNLRLLRTMLDLLTGDLRYLDTDRWGPEADDRYRQTLVGYVQCLKTELLDLYEPQSERKEQNKCCI